jgi:hypothetical protein
MISAITSRGHLRFVILEDGSVNADAEFIKRLLVGVKRKIFLVVDGGPAHRAKKTKPLSKACRENCGYSFFLPIRRTEVQTTWCGSA